jgi:serine phosphatase RsbU (regulator of sigma subunit)
VSLLIANFSGTAIVRMSHVTTGMVAGRNERAESLPLAGSDYREVLLSQELRVGPGDAGSWLVLVPVTERGDAIGLLELSLPADPGTETLAFLTSAAHALAYVLIASRRHTDLFEWAQRDVPFSLAAEIQRRLLPASYTIEAGRLTVAGWLEPASRVGGDTFDYSLDREFLYASITDAMGHGTQAALLATLVVGSLRNGRRRLASPSEQADQANRTLLEEGDAEQFVTGQLLRVRLGDGRLELVNAGHPSPLLIRDGAQVSLDVPDNPVFGVVETHYDTVVRQLQPGDRLLLVTDGFLERNAAGVDIGRIVATVADRHPREVVRELADRVMRATGGDLEDDATVLCIDWYGPLPGRGSSGGASHQRVTGH